MTTFIIAGILIIYGFIAWIIAELLDLHGSPSPRIRNGFDVAAGCVGLTIAPAYIGAGIFGIVGLVNLL